MKLLSSMVEDVTWRRCNEYFDNVVADDVVDDTDDVGGVAAFIEKEAKFVVGEKA